MSTEIKNESNNNKEADELKALRDETIECRNQIESILRSNPSIAGKGVWDIDADTPVAAFLLSLVSEESDVDKKDYKKLITEIDQEIADIALKISIEDLWPELLVLTDEHPKNVFENVVCMHETYNPWKTPEGIVNLSKRILNVNENDIFYDMCCGTGSVTFSVRKDVPGAKIVGYDIHSEAIAIAKMYNSISNANITFMNEDIFELDSVEKATKIFSNYPFKVSLRNLGFGKKYLDSVEKRVSTMSKATSSDWLFNMLLVDKLADDGKAIGIMTNGSAWNRIDSKIRKYFVENGFIETVIELPSNLFTRTSVAVSLIVFSHNNKGVRLIDGSKTFVHGRRINTIDEKCVEKIIEATKKDNDISMYISKEQLRDNDYVLHLSRYLGVNKEIEDGVKFGSIIKRITRGAPITAKGLDKIASAKPTNMQLLKLSNIDNGLIDKDLSYISEIEKKNEKYCLTNHCIILSKNGYPYKIAVAEIKEGHTIMASGNVYIIELDENKVDPYYVAAFLESEKGTTALKSITVGATIPNIGVEQLKKIIIPVPSLDNQREISDAYKSVRDEIMVLQLKLEKAKNRRSQLFDNGGDEGA